MPVQFSQPEPAAPALYEQLGFYQQMQNAQEQALQRAQFQFAQQQHGDAMAMQAAQMGQQAYQFQQEQAQQAAMASFHAQQQRQQQETEYNQALSLHDAQLTQAEKMRMQRLEQTISDIQTARDNNQITPQDAQDAILQARTGYDPLAKKQAQAQLQTQQLARQRLDQEVQHAADLEQRTAAFRARSLADRTSLVPDPRILAEVQNDHQRDFPSLWNNPNLDPAVEQQRNDMINREVAARGGMRRYTEIRPGEYHLEEVRPDPTELTRHERLDLQRRNEADVRADIQHQRWTPPQPPASLTTQAEKDDFQERAIQIEAERRMAAQEGRARRGRWGGATPENRPSGGGVGLAIDQVLGGGLRPLPTPAPVPWGHHPPEPPQSQNPASQTEIQNAIDTLGRGRIEGGNVPERFFNLIGLREQMQRDAIALLRVRRSRPWTPEELAEFRNIHRNYTNVARDTEGESEPRRLLARHMVAYMEPFLTR